MGGSYPPDIQESDKFIVGQPRTFPLGVELACDMHGQIIRIQNLGQRSMLGLPQETMQAINPAISPVAESDQNGSLPNS